MTPPLDCLEFVGLAEAADTPAGDLPYGKQRLLEMARALAAEPAAAPRRPAAGLNSKETAQLGDLIRAVCDHENVTVGLVEHDMELVVAVRRPHHQTLHFGQPLAAGTPTPSRPTRT